jgi:hypothetical protein
MLKVDVKSNYVFMHTHFMLIYKRNNKLDGKYNITYLGSIFNIYFKIYIRFNKLIRFTFQFDSDSIYRLWVLRLRLYLRIT